MRGRGAQVAMGLPAGRGTKRTVKGDLHGGAWWWSPFNYGMEKRYRHLEVSVSRSLLSIYNMYSRRNLEAAFGHGGAKP
jgi:hypothetical protein